MIQKYKEQMLVKLEHSLTDHWIKYSDTNEKRNTEQLLYKNYNNDIQIDEKINVNLQTKRQAAVNGEIRWIFTNR